MTLIIPNTYEIYWNSSPNEFMKRMSKESNAFWTDSRIDNAILLGLSKEEVITIASIVEEETNNIEEKPTIASVYINRLKQGMPLGADPTIKFAVGDFRIRRVTFGHISSTAGSPYNTYRNKGLPPGPICTPSIASIDAVLKAEKTDYLYFCARADFSGSHSFASTAEEHFENMKYLDFTINTQEELKPTFSIMSVNEIIVPVFVIFPILILSTFFAITPHSIFLLFFSQTCFISGASMPNKRYLTLSI